MATRRRGTGEPDPLQLRAVARLNEVLESRGITKNALALRAGFTQGHVWRVLEGKSTEPAFWVIARLARALDVSLDWLTEEPRAARPAASEPPATPRKVPAAR